MRLLETRVGDVRQEPVDGGLDGKSDLKQNLIDRPRVQIEPNLRLPSLDGISAKPMLSGTLKFIFIFASGFSA